MKTIQTLLSIIIVLLVYIAFQLTANVTAGARWQDVNIAAVSGKPIYDAVPTK